MTKVIDNPFSDTLLGVLLGLSIKSAFDHFFSRLDATMTLTTAIQLVNGHRALFLLRLFQIVVFLFLLSRFYLGAYRYSKVAPSQTMFEALIDTIGVFLLFAGFYVASIVVRNIDLFYWAIVAFLIVDLVWFVTARLIRDLEGPVNCVTNLWIIFDVLTIVIVSVSMLIFSGLCAEWIALSALLLISAWDIRWLRHFYSGSPDWAPNTYWIKNFVASS